jgi:hypothetical protein
MEKENSEIKFESNGSFCESSFCRKQWTILSKAHRKIEEARKRMGAGRCQPDNNSLDIQ